MDRVRDLLEPGEVPRFHDAAVRVCRDREIVARFQTLRADGRTKEHALAIMERETFAGQRMTAAGLSGVLYPRRRR